MSGRKNRRNDPAQVCREPGQGIKGVLHVVLGSPNIARVCQKTRPSRNSQADHPENCADRNKSGDELLAAKEGHNRWEHKMILIQAEGQPTPRGKFPRALQRPPGNAIKKQQQDRILPLDQGAENGKVSKAGEQPKDHRRFSQHAEPSREAGKEWNPTKPDLQPAK